MRRSLLRSPRAHEPGPRDPRLPDRYDWALYDDAEARAFTQQLVDTAMDEPSFHRVLVTQDGGMPAVIGVKVVTTTYHTALTRQQVTTWVEPEEGGQP